MCRKRWRECAGLLISGSRNPRENCSYFKGSEWIRYDGVLIQSLFLRALETGINNENIINCVRTFIEETTIGDDQILISQFNLAVAANNERTTKLQDISTNNKDG